MAELRKIKERIAEIAARRRNVTVGEIEWVVNQLKLHGHQIRIRDTTHMRMYRVDSQRFGICCHHPGEKQIKACYVDEFISAMIELGLYEE